MPKEPTLPDLIAICQRGTIPTMCETDMLTQYQRSFKP